MKFTVGVRTADGKQEKRVVDAPSRFAVYSQIEKEGGAVESIDEGGGSKLPAWLNISIGGGVKTEEKITFTKNLSAMLTAGLTLSRALSVIERQATKKALMRVSQDLSAEVKKGTSFHEALAQHPEVFSELFIAMTRAGEESGTLADSLKAVALQMERAHTLAKKIKGAMIYPAIILFAIVVIGILMLIFVVPTLSSTFKELGVPLPFATRAIVGTSDFVTNHVILLVLGIVAVIAGVYSFAKSRIGGAVFLWTALHLPVIKTLVRETYSARAARSLSSLLSSGVQMLTAIGIAKEVVGNGAFAAVLAEAEVRVRKGEQLSVAFSDHPNLYPVFVGDMIAVGEETGNVAQMLSQVAEYYEADVEEQTKDLSTVIEPFLMLIIGAVVGVFAVAMIAPIYSISSAIN